MTWEPDLASKELEELMESKDLPESDRDELRRMAEFIARRKAKKEGKELPPAPKGMLEWIAGEDKDP